MPNAHPVQYFNSDWPQRLRQLRVNDTLYIPAQELTARQVTALVNNMNYRLKGRGVFKAIHDEQGNSVVHCLVKEGDLTRKRNPSPLVVATSDVPNTPAPKSKIKAEKGKPGRPKGVSRIMPKPIEAIAILECTFVNGGAQTMRASNERELNAILERCRNNPQVTEIITYSRADHQRKQVAWQPA